MKQVIVGWPAPKRHEQDGLYSFGYDGVAEFPVTIIPEEIGQPVDVKLEFSAVVCNRICVPQSLSIDQDVPAGPAIQSPYYSYTQELAASIPAAYVDGKDIKLDTAVLGKDALVITAYAKDGFDGTDLFVESDDVIFTAPPEVQVSVNDPHTAVIKIPAPPGTDLTQSLFGKSAILTLVTKSQSIEKEFTF